jgi:hypothetical protein
MVKKVIMLVVAVIWALSLTTLAYAQCSAKLLEGTKEVLTVKACPDSRFIRWEGVICQEGNTSKTCTFIMPAKDLTVKPVFIKKPPAPKWKPNM